MAILETFAPAYGTGVIVAPTNVSANSILGYNTKTICLTNLGGVVCYVRTFARANGIVAATTADYPVPFAQVTISKPDDHDSIAYIVVGAVAGSLHIMAGEGF